MTQRWKVTLTDGIGPDGLHKGTVLYMPSDWDSSRISAEICAFADRLLVEEPGTVYLVPEIIQGTEHTSVYYGLAPVATVRLVMDYTGGVRSLEIVPVADQDASGTRVRQSRLSPFPWGVF